MADEKSQVEEFKDLARKVEANPDLKTWDERLRKLAANRPDKFFTPEQVVENLLGMDDPARQKRKPASEQAE